MVVKFRVGGEGLCMFIGLVDYAAILGCAVGFLCESGSCQGQVLVGSGRGRDSAAVRVTG